MILCELPEDQLRFHTRYLSTITIVLIGFLEAIHAFTALDALWKNCQVSINDEYRNRTSFTSHTGTYRFTCKPFGIRNAQPMFQREFSNILFEVQWKTCLDYEKKAIVFLRKICKHVKDIEKVLTLLRQNRVTVKRCKYHFFGSKLNILVVYGSLKAQQLPL